MAATGSAAPDHLDPPGAGPFRPRLRHAGLRNLDRTRLAALTQSWRGATASAKSPDDGERAEIASDYHVGCDGARSAPRRTSTPGAMVTPWCSVRGPLSSAPRIRRAACGRGGPGPPSRRPSAQRQHMRHRRPRAAAGAQPRVAGADRLRGGGPRRLPAHHPQRGFGPTPGGRQQGGLDPQPPRRDRSRECPTICGGAAVEGFEAIGMTSRGNMQRPACARTRCAEGGPHKQRQRSHVEDLSVGLFGMNGRHGRGTRRTRPSLGSANGARAASSTTTGRQRAPGPRC